jgi:pimeloyl-ACP methyl ester carboxylesterase
MQTMAAAMPHAECVTLPGCAHLSAVEQPWGFTDLVQAFIDQQG